MFDLCCGLGGATEGFLAEGWHCIGVDIERHVYGAHRYPAQLWIQDLLTIDGVQLRHADFIWASCPCQEFSWMAMPWSRAKQVARALRGEDEFPPGYRGSRTLAELTRLFDACFRIQREASEAAGRHIPMVVENVKGAQPWVGRARWNFGSFYLWGDVPALMPPIADRQTKNAGGSWFNVAHNTTSGTGQNPVHELAGEKAEGTKQKGSGAASWDDVLNERRRAATGIKNAGCDLTDVGFNVASARQHGHMVEGVKIVRSAEDKRQHIGTSRKFASAMIAKIPAPLASWIARSYYPKQIEVA